MAWNERQILNRRFQAKMNQEDAFITGYFFVYFELPEQVGTVYNDLWGEWQPPDKIDLTAGKDVSQMGLMLSALTTGIPSIPDTTLAKTANIGMGGPKWGVATNLDHPTTVTFKFRELTSIPITKTIVSWFTLIRDPNAGVSLLTGKEGTTKYTKTNYQGRAVVGYVKPDGINVEMGTRYEGIFPIKYPSDLFTSDVATVEPIEPEIEFHVDSIWSDTKAFDDAKNIIAKFNQNQPFAESAKASIYKEESSNG